MFETFFGNQENDDDTEFMPIIPMEDDGSMGKMGKIPGHMPILALKNTVLYPGVIIPITVGRDKSIKSIKKAFDTSSRAIGVLSQRDIQKEDPGKADLYEIGTVAKIMKLLRMPDGTTTAILRGQKRFRLDELTKQKPYLEGSISLLEEQKKSGSLEFTALISTIMDMAKKIIELSPNIPSEAIAMLKSIEDNTFLLNFIASNLNSTIEVKQLILETDDQAGKAELILGEISRQLQLLEFKDQIETKVRVDIDKQQRDYFLNQQLKTIQDELGQNPQEEEITRISAKAENIKWSEKTAKHFQKELARLKRINPHSPDYSMQITYLDLLTELPWDKTSADIFDLNKVKKTLDADHFGLEKVKERIIEHLAVLKLKGDMKAPIICLVGPPGVGKTSLGKSIAKATGRDFVRVSLGGVRDESEIRGHRRTYIGSMPGRVIQSMKKAKSANPLFLLDEIDKMGADYRGDPAAAGRVSLCRRGEERGPRRHLVGEPLSRRAGRRREPLLLLQLRAIRSLVGVLRTPARVAELLRRGHGTSQCDRARPVQHRSALRGLERRLRRLVGDRSRRRRPHRGTAGAGSDQRGGPTQPAVRARPSGR